MELKGPIDLISNPSVFADYIIDVSSQKWSAQIASSSSKKGGIETWMIGLKNMHTNWLETVTRWMSFIGQLEDKLLKV